MPDFADTSDVLNLSTALRRHSVNRVVFNPEDQQHVDSLKAFLRTGNWGDFQFYCESPYTDVPMTVLMAFAQYELNVTRETTAERNARVAAKAALIEADEAAVDPA